MQAEQVKVVVDFIPATVVRAYDKFAAGPFFL